MLQSKSISPHSSITLKYESALPACHSHKRTHRHTWATLKQAHNALHGKMLMKGRGLKIQLAVWLCARVCVQR